MKAREIVKKLKEAGFREISQKGSHLKMMKGEKTTIVPVHPSRDIPIGTVKNIEKQSGVKLL
ncbi:MAG: type II toxin-antitoxin system HicA family toxin [Bacteriovorax sp.]|nr:type II toxin-antitoxin system HicA family toxin [Bacteriovorax sp.]